MLCARFEFAEACGLDNSHRITEVHVAQNKASMFQQITKPFQFTSLRRNGVLIRWIVSDDILREPIQTAKMQVLFVEERRANDALLNMPDIAKVDLGSVYSKHVIGIDKTSDFVEQTIGDAERCTKLFDLNSEGGVVEGVHQENLIVNEVLLARSGAFVEQPSSGNKLLLHLVEPSDEGRRVSNRRDVRW